MHIRSSTLLAVSCLILAITLPLRADPPAVTSATLTAWIDATDVNGNATTPANGAAVTTWVNKAAGGIGNFTVTAGGTVNPSYTAASSAFKGLPVVRFTPGTGKLLTNLANLGNNMTVMYVGRKTGTDVGRLVSSPGTNWLLGYWGVRQGCSFWGNVGNFAGNATNDNNARVWTGAADGSQYFVYRADLGVPEVQVDTGALGALGSGPNGLSLGAYTTGSEVGGGDIGELLVYNGALSQTDRTNVQAYLLAKWISTPNYTNAVIGYWPFNDGAGGALSDESNFGNHGALRNSPSWVAGRFGGALSFNGSSQWVYVPDYPKPTTTLTISAWVYANARPSFATIIKNWPAANQQFHFGLEGTAGDLSNYLKPQGVAQVGPVREGAATPLPLSAWHHVALVCDGQNLRLYRNGNQVGAALAYNGTIQTNPVNQFLSIGSKATSSSAADSFWNGMLDDIVLWSRDLTTAEIQGIYNAGVTNNSFGTFLGPRPPGIGIQPQGYTRYAGELGPTNLSVSAGGPGPVAFQWLRNGASIPNATNALLPLNAIVTTNDTANYTVIITNTYGSVTSAVASVVVLPLASISDGLAAYWPFDETTGTNTTDATVNANHGVLKNYPADNTQWLPGRIGGALRFWGAGSNNYVFVNNYPKPGANMTISAWVWADSRPAWATIIKNWMGPGFQFHYGLDASTGDMSNYLIQQGGAQVGPVREGTGTPLPTNSWQHVALVCDGAFMRLYRNGVPVGAAVAYNGTIQTNPVNQFLGIGVKLQTSGVPATDGTQGYWQGKMDDMALWTRTLTADEIFSIYRTGTNGQPLTAAPLGNAPFVTVQPQGVSRYVGEYAPNLTPAAAGTAPLAYQWRKDGVDIPGANAAAYPLGLVTNGMGGSYALVITNLFGSITSAPAVVTVSAVAAVSDALAGYWNFDEGTGATLIDNSGNGNDGTLINFPVDDTQWMSGRVGGALRFGGPTVSQYVTVPNYPKPSSTMTISAWVFVEARTTWATIVKNWQTVPGAQFHFGLDNATGDLSNYLVPNTGAQIGPVREGAGTPIPLNSWQHVALVCDGQNMRLYRNGLQVGTPFAYNGTINTNCSASFGLGAKLGPGGVPPAAVDAGYWQGKMDDLGLWTRGLAPDEVFAIFMTGLRNLPLTDAVGGPQAPLIASDPQGYSRYVGEVAPVLTASAGGTAPLFYQWRRNGADISGATNTTLSMGVVTNGTAGSYTFVATNAGGSITSAPAVVTVQAVAAITDGLAGYWNFDEGFGTTLVDFSGNGNDGTLNNYPDDSSWMSGQIGGALAFGGPVSSNWVFVPNYPKPTSTLTVSAWVLATSRPTWATILKNWPASGQQFHFGLDNNTGDLSNYLIQQGGGTVGPVREGAATPLPTNSWQHVALVCNGGAMQLYRNGQPVGSPLAYDGTINTNLANQSMAIGAKLLTNNLPDGGSPGYWHGKMDDLGLWTRGLTAAEVNAIYRAGCGAFPLSEADLNAVLPTITQDAQSATNYTGSTHTFSVSTTGGGTLHYQWLSNGVALSGQTSAALVIPSLQLVHAGDYRVVVASAAGCVTGAVATLTVLPNSPPVAGDADGSTAQNTVLAVTHAKLLTGCSDPDNDSLTVSAAGPTSTNGGVVTRTATHVNYTPVNGFIGVDRFTFTVSDGKGGTATATVTVGVYDSGAGFNRVTFTVSGGQVHLGYAGIPGYTYTIERTPTLSPASWTSIGTATADGLGRVSFTDPSPPPGSAFYRTAYP